MKNPLSDLLQRRRKKGISLFLGGEEREFRSEESVSLAFREGVNTECFPRPSGRD